MTTRQNAANGEAVRAFLDKDHFLREGLVAAYANKDKDERTRLLRQVADGTGVTIKTAHNVVAYAIKTQKEGYQHQPRQDKTRPKLRRSTKGAPKTRTPKTQGASVLSMEVNVPDGGLCLKIRQPSGTVVGTLQVTTTSLSYVPRAAKPKDRRWIQLDKLAKLVEAMGD